MPDQIINTQPSRISDRLAASTRSAGNPARTYAATMDRMLATTSVGAVDAGSAATLNPTLAFAYISASWKVAKSAQRFWDDCQVLPKGDAPVEPKTGPRLQLWQATRIVLENGLGLLGVSAPERM